MKKKNMLKIISYISKINKTQKNMKRLLSEFMKNINFTYEEEKCNIKYEEYYFNGNIYIPKNIQFKEINYNTINLTWNLDLMNNLILNIDKDKIKYNVELKKENEQFKQIYEGKNNECNINNLDLNTNYYIRIRSSYDNIKGEWTEEQKIKTFIDSIPYIETF